MDERRVYFIAKRLVGVVRANYLQGPAGQEREAEALHALAFTVAIVLAAASDGSREVFYRILEDHIEEVLREQEEKEW